jgi:DNA-binding Xre family transcriptional regulator
VSDELSRAVAAEIQRLLDERGWSQRELARRSGLSQSNLTRKLLEDGRRFDLDDLPPICAALGINLTDLLTWAQRR